MNADQTTTMLALLERIATALEKQNTVVDELVGMTCGVANRIEDIGRYMPSVPDSFYTFLMGRK
jgi:hypothetical protein